MANTERRAAARRRAWGRGPMILRFEPLEGRQLMATFATTGTSSGAAGATTSNSSSSAAAAASGNASAPDLVAADVGAPESLDWGDTFHATGDILNQGGSTTTAPFAVQVYASTTPTINASAILVGTVSVPAGLAPGSQAHFDQVLNAPPSAPLDLGAASTYYLSLRVNPGQTVAESRTDNNEAPGGYQGYTVVHVAPRQSPQLASSTLSATPTTPSWGGNISIGTTITNSGQGNAPASRALVVLTPAGEIPGGVDDTTIGSLDVPAIAAGQSATLTQALTLPATIPTSLAGSKQLVLSLVLDADHLTSTATTTATRGWGIDGALITPAAGSGTAADATKLPSLAVETVQIPSQALRYGQPFQVSARVQNSGTADAGPFRVRYALVDDDNAALPPIALADATLTGLQAGYAQDVAQTIPFPSKLPAGLTAGSTVNAHVVVTVDPEHAVGQSSPAGGSLNGAASSVTLALPTAGVVAALPADGARTQASASAPATAAGTPASTTVGATSTAITGAAVPTLTPAQKRTAALANAKARRDAIKADAAIARAKARAKALANAQAVAARHHRVK